jgi:hypothetical protein
LPATALCRRGRAWEGQSKVAAVRIYSLGTPALLLPPPRRFQDAAEGRGRRRGAGARPPGRMWQGWWRRRAGGVVETAGQRVLEVCWRRRLRRGTRTRHAVRGVDPSGWLDQRSKAELRPQIEEPDAVLLECCTRYSSVSFLILRMGRPPLDYPHRHPG